MYAAAKELVAWWARGTDAPVTNNMAAPKDYKSFW